MFPVPSKAINTLNQTLFVYIVEKYAVHIYILKFLGSGKGIFLLFCFYGIWRRAKTGINFTNQLESTGVGEGTRNALVYFFPS